MAQSFTGRAADREKLPRLLLFAPALLSFSALLPTSISLSRARQRRYGRGGANFRVIRTSRAHRAIEISRHRSLSLSPATPRLSPALYLPELIARAAYIDRRLHVAVAVKHCTAARRAGATREDFEPSCLRGKPAARALFSAALPARRGRPLFFPSAEKNGARPFIMNERLAPF